MNKTPGTDICPLCHAESSFSFEGKDFLHGGEKTFTYHKCNTCNCEYQFPFPTLEQIASFYPETYMIYSEVDPPKPIRWLQKAVLELKYGYSHLKTPKTRQWIARLVALLRYQDAIRYIPNGKGLDVGCGNGKFIAKMNSLGWRFQGVEFNSKAVEICRRSNLEVFHGDLSEANFPDNHFDIVTARHLIEHLPAPHDFMREVSRILTTKGRLVIQTPNSQALGRKWFGKYWYANDIPRHLVLYSPKNLKDLARRYDLVQTALRTFTTPKILLNSWDYLVGNRGKPSRKNNFKRLISKPYVFLAQVLKRGDEIFAIFEKK